MNKSSCISIALSLAMMAIPTSPSSSVPEESPTRDLSHYVVMYEALPWEEAKASCVNDDGWLAFPASKREFALLQHIVRGIQYDKVTGTDYKVMAWVGISNLDDFRTWRNIRGEDINSTEFHSWVGGNGGSSSNPLEPHCAGVDAINTGLRDWWCHLPLAYICRMH